VSHNRRKIPQLLQNPFVIELAKTHGKSPAQVLLRFLIQALSVVVIPKSKDSKRLQENIEVFHKMLLGVQHVFPPCIKTCFAIAYLTVTDFRFRTVYRRCNEVESAGRRR
jgi:hypothetical protein